MAASLAAQVHRQTMYSEQEAMKDHWRAAAGQGATAADMAATIPLDKFARRRRNTITSSAEGCFFHLGQTLDRLAAAAIIVGGFKIHTAITAIYWSTLDQIASSLQAQNPKNPVLAPIGTPGRASQVDLVKPVQDWEQYGEPGWLSWLKDTRNAATHRAVGMKFNVFADDRLTRLFFRHPKISEVQSLVFAGKPPTAKFLDAFILSASQDILDGLCDSTVKLVVAVVDAMEACWTLRKTSPGMIVQPFEQWPVVEPPQSMSAFAGYGTVSLAGEKVMMNPLDWVRWTAARVLDDRRSDWYRAHRRPVALSSRLRIDSDNLLVMTEAKWQA